MPEITENGCVFIGSSHDADKFRGWRVSGFPRPPDDVVFITNAVDVAVGTPPRKIDGIAYIRDVAAGRVK